MVHFGNGDMENISVHYCISYLRGWQVLAIRGSFCGLNWLKMMQHKQVFACFSNSKLCCVDVDTEKNAKLCSSSVFILIC